MVTAAAGKLLVHIAAAGMVRGDASGDSKHGMLVSAAAGLAALAAAAAPAGKGLGGLNVCVSTTASFIPLFIPKGKNDWQQHPRPNGRYSLHR